MWGSRGEPGQGLIPLSCPGEPGLPPLCHVHEGSSHSEEQGTRPAPCLVESPVPRGSPEAGWWPPWAALGRVVGPTTELLVRPGLDTSRHSRELRSLRSGQAPRFLPRASPGGFWSSSCSPGETERA